VQRKGKQVCRCFGVEAPAIEAHLAQCGGAPAQRLASVQGALRCGTNCGSCVPELQRMVRAIAPLPKVA
jgi:assimilatory nitrate reductase catalytic subunit